ncbi:MAG: hypothetical protein ACHRXM_16210 [Isosphaerales bacterium]
MPVAYRIARGLGRCLVSSVLPAIFVAFGPTPIAAQGPAPAGGQAPTRIIAHYMPWYEAKPHSPGWGWHWTMGTFDPEDRTSGRRALASHYRPLIGPYDSGDLDVLEYHALLMKLAGIDGVILDWYGTVDFQDYAQIHRNSSAFAEQAARTGLAFAVCYEDRTIPQLYKEAARWPVGMAVAFPRFHDIYEQAGVHKSWGRIDDDNGTTFAATMEKSLRSGMPLVQICTWNDWGEGTMIEPSIEFGYRDLEVIQRLRRQLIEPGFAGLPEDLRLVHRLYMLRKDTKKGSCKAQDLDEVARLLVNRSSKAAREKLDLIEAQRRRTG